MLDLRDDPGGVLESAVAVAAATLLLEPPARLALAAVQRNLPAMGQTLLANLWLWGELARRVWQAQLASRNR